MVFWGGGDKNGDLLALCSLCPRPNVPITSYGMVKLIDVDKLCKCTLSKTLEI